MTRMISNFMACAAVVVICVPGSVSSRSQQWAHRSGFISRRNLNTIRCEDQARTVKYSGLWPNFTVQYGCIENLEIMSGSLGAMLQGKNPAAGALP
jgi:hypothetical protein